MTSQSIRTHSSVSFTIALPVYNEEAILERLHGLLTDACHRVGQDYEILYVNDGSRDGTPAVLHKLAEDDPHVSVVTLSRNFGHPAALAAAIDVASGEVLVLMDADLQDDPAAIPELLRLHCEEDAEVVYVVRNSRKENLVMRTLFALFHRAIARSSAHHLARDTGSFGLLGPRALTEVRNLTERLRYFPGLRAFVGFKQVPLVVERGARYDRASRVGFRGLVRLAGLAFFSQSRLPVTLFYALSAASLLTALGLVSYALISKVLGNAVVTWASTITAVAFFSSIIILGQAFICEYLARVYEEVRRRPVYIVDTILRAPRASKEVPGVTTHQA